jgi:hypothetical protein
MKGWQKTRAMDSAHGDIPQQQEQPRGGRLGYRGLWGYPGGSERGIESKETQVEIPTLQTDKVVRLRWLRIAIVYVTVGLIAFVSAVVTVRVEPFSVVAWPAYLIIGASVVIGLANVAKNTVNSAAMSPYLVDYLEKQRREYADWFYAPAIGVGLVLVGLGAAWGDWRAWVILFAAWFIWGLWYAYIEPISLALYRYMSEIVDPHGPTSPRYPEARGGPRLPGDPEPAASGNGDDERLDDIQEMLERVLRRQEMPKERTRLIDLNRREKERLPKDRICKPGEGVIEAPSKRSVPEHLLVSFVRKAESVGTGIREWKRLGWDEPLWNDVIDIWEKLGCFQRGAPGVSGKFVVSFEDAVMVLKGK